jgi:DNA primase small subunit
MAEQEWGNEQYVSEQFSRYYVSNIRSIEAPSEIGKREFGFLSFGGRTMFRHIGFESPTLLMNYLKQYSPAHSYFSAAYYRDPSASMPEKGWLGADLVFDIDADHFDLPCQKTHDRWTCKSCGMKGEGRPLELCPNCQKASFDEESWLCERCLEAAKFEAQKLLDILIQDFGFDSDQELSINFSGNRGYHVHVKSSSVKQLNQPARREIVDYIMGIGIEAEYQGLDKSREGAHMTKGGWRGRTAKTLYDFIISVSQERLKSLKLGRNATRNIIEYKNDVLNALLIGNPRMILKYIDQKSLDKIIPLAVKTQASAIDTVVTTDLRRLIRLPNTLHGRTGWLSIKVSIDEIANFQFQSSQNCNSLYGRDRKGIHQENPRNKNCRKDLWPL